MTTPIIEIDLGPMPYSIIYRPQTVGSWVRLTDVARNSNATTSIPRGVNQLAVQWTGSGEVRVYNTPRSGGAGRHIATLKGGTDLTPATAICEAWSEDGAGTIHVSMVNITQQDVDEGGRCTVRVMPMPPQE